MLLVAAIFKGAQNAINALKSDLHVQYMVNGAKLQMQGILSKSDTLAALVGKISGILKCVEGSFTAEAMAYLEQYLTAEKGSMEVVRKLEKELGDKKTQLDTAKARRNIESLDDGKSVDDVVAELKVLCEGSETTKLYRVMVQEEYDSLMSNGKFVFFDTAMEEKWFATTPKDAAKWGRIFYPDGNYRMVEIEVKTDSLNQMYYNQHLDNIGPAYCASLDLLEEVIQSIKGVK